MRISFWLLLCLFQLVFFCANAQKIRKAEYFIDTDPGTGLATSINTGTVADSITKTFSISVGSGITQGIHRIVVRAQDDKGRWGLGMNQYFFVLPGNLASGTGSKIKKAEYFIDSDPGVGLATGISTGTAADSISKVFGISIGSGISQGIHRIVVRTQDVNGRWGLGMNQYFFVLPGNLATGTGSKIKKAEYFIDTDPGVGLATGISTGTSADSISTIFSIPVASGISQGIHRIVVRTQDVNGRWGLGLNQYFFVLPPNLTTGTGEKILAAEFFVNKDPGVGKGIPISISGPLDSLGLLANLTIPGALLSAPLDTVSIRVKDAKGRWSLHLTDTIRVQGCNPISSANFTIGTNLCKNQAIGFTNTSTNVPNGSTYSWDLDDNGVIDKIGPGPHSFIFSSPGTYTAILSIQESGCVARKSIQFTIPEFQASITPNGPTTFCSGSNVQLTAGPAQSYLWNQGGQTSQTITVSSTQLVRLIATSNLGCKDTAYQQVTISNQVAASITPDGPISFCQGGSVQLVASSGGTYLWSPGGATSQSIQVTQSGNYSVTVTYPGGCNSSANQTVTVNPNPTAQITPTGPITFCQGGSVTLTANAGSSWFWPATGQTTQSITVNSSGNYTVQVYNAQGCFGSASQTITVTDDITVGISANGTTTFCNGDSVVLTASGANTYLWSPGGQTTAAIKVKTGGNYSVTGTGAGSCTGNASIEIKVNTAEVPSISASGPLSFCSGGSVVLTSSSPTGNLWSNGATTQDITVSSTGSFTVRQTDENGCLSLNSAPTAVNVSSTPATPTISASGPLNFCQGGTVTLTSSANTGNAWNTGATSKSITVTNSGTFFVTVGTGCTATSANSVVSVTPVTQGTFEPITSFCIGTTPPLLPNISTNGIPGTWLPATVSNTASGDYIFTPSTGSCKLTTNLSVTVNQVSTPVFAAIGPIVAGTTPPTLPSASINGFLGTWNPATISNSQTRSYLFTPNPGQCASTASMTIVVNEYPDLAVQNVTSVSTLIAPGDVVTVSWSARNVGTAPSPQEWTEKIYFQAPGGANRTLLSSSIFTSASTLGVGQNLSRSSAVTMPSQLDQGDQGVFVVEIIPFGTVNEPTEFTTNNTGVQTTPWNIKKILTLELSSTEITEGGSVSATVNRSGSSAQALTFSIALSPSSRFSFPGTVTIPAGQASRTFTLTAIENTLIEGTLAANLTVSASGFQSGTSGLVLYDNEKASLSFQNLPVSSGEGNTVSFLVSTNLAPTSPLSVYLTSSNSTRFPVPLSVQIPAGQLSAPINVVLTQDNIPEIDEAITVTAGAANLDPASGNIQITDDDIPGIELVFSKKVVSESEGFYATQATLKRIPGGSPVAFSVNLNADYSNTLIFPPAVPMAANEISKTFTIGVVDDGLVNGARRVKISAALFVSSCGCNAPNTTAGYFEDTLRILDNDGPTLTLSTPVLTLAEGQASAALLRITRNTPNGSSLLVNLNSSNPGEATVPSSVLIPAGADFAEVPVTTVNDNITDGSKQVNLTATSTGFSTGTLWVIVTDINKPDLVLENVNLSSSTVEAKTIFTYGFRIANTGFAHNPAGVRVKGYLSKDDFLDDSDSLITNDQIIQPILTTQPNNFVNAVQAPNRPGSYKLIFKVNPEADFSELNYDNNTAASVALDIVPEYDATAKVDSVWFIQGSQIAIKGKATRTNGSNAANVPLDVYVVTSNGLRRTYTSQTDALGNYTYLFQPISNEVGSYTVGACFPGYGNETTDDSFDILGVRINDGNLPVFKATIGDTLRGKLPISNLCGFPIRNVSLNSISLPQGARFQFGKVANLEPGIIDSISYKAWGVSVSPGNDFLPASFQVTSAKGNLQQQDAFYYCQSQQAFISTNLNFIDVKISASAGQKLVQFKLTNLGQGNSGQIKINLPQSNWLSSVSNTTIPDLEPGDTSSVILRFSALPEVPFEFPITGSIGIQVAVGNSFSIPFSFEKVSQTTGTVAVEVTNQFTYYAAGSPKVAGANVQIRNYYSGVLYGEGVTDSSGLFYVSNVPEGVHRINIDKERHLGFSGTISIAPGDTVRKSVFINYQAITFNWNVEPTAIQDQYDITLTATFETNIPMPVVVLDMPKSMPSLQGDQEYAFMATLINHGLITAKDVKLNLPQGDPEYEFVTNYTQSDLLALQSIQVPVIMRRRQNQGAPVAGKPSLSEISSFLGISAPGVVANSSGLPCQDFANYIYWYKCGSDGVWQQGGSLFSYSNRICSGEGGGNYSCFCLPGIGGGGGYPTCANCPPPIIIGGGNAPPAPVETARKNCKQAINDLAQALAGSLGINIPPDVKCKADGYANETGPKEYFNCLVKENTVGRLTTITNGVVGTIPIIGPLYNGLNNTATLIGALSDFQNSFDNNRGGIGSETVTTSSNENSLGGELKENLIVVQDGYLLRGKWSKEYFGDLTDNNSWYQFYVQIAPFVDSLEHIPNQKQDSIIQSMTGYEIPLIQLQNFFVRWNQSITARDLDILSPNAQYPNIINWIRIKQISDSLVTGYNFAISKGFSGIHSMHAYVIETVDSLTKPQSQSVCASVKVQFSQTLTMTREAFRGTLDIFNGHPTDKMDSLSVNILVTDANGVPSNGVFQINTEQLINLSDVTGTGKINAQQSGTAKFLFIPELGAAPTVPKVYNFGGSVRYFDPYARAMVTLPLNAVSLTVNPSPNLQLHYFMQRDILGDDALTSPKIEPSIPAELAVMVENWGYGPAVNMTISSAQPKIVDNEKGLAINFNLIGSNFQGQPRQLGVTNINFGTLPPLKTRIGEWYFTSSLLGKFVSYEASVVHANSFGNPDLSLVKGVKLHELTKSVRVYGALDDTIGDFLANDVPDIGNTPDILYLSQGKQTEEVFVATSGSFNQLVGAPSFTNTLTVTSSNAGWNYIKINDPGANRYNIQSITRSDGQVIPLDNAWLTFVTLPAAQEPIYENKFQFVDKFPSATAQTYTVVWGPKNENVPEVDSILGTPLSVTSSQVSQVRVKFSKAINPATFNWQDLDLVFQGGPNIANNSITVTQVDTATFDLDLSNVTTGNGTYKLVVQAAEVEDAYGISGLSGKQVIWTQYLNVPVVQSFEGIPASKRSKSFDSVYVVFNLPIDTLSLTSGRFKIKKGTVMLPGTIGVSKADSLQKRFLLTGISSIMTVDTAYSLVVDLPQIKSKTQVFGLAEQSVVLTLDRTGPVLTSLTKSNAGGLDVQHYPNFSLVFNEALTGFNVAAFQLTRNGENVAIPIDKLSSSDQKTWTVGNLGLLTYLEGNYVFKVNLANAKDDLGNAGTGNQQVAWTVNRSLTLGVTNLSINPDKGFSSTDGISSDLSLTLNYTLGAAASQVVISQTFSGSETFLTTLTNVTAGAKSVSLNLPSGGNTGLKVSALGADGASGSASIPLFLDQQTLSANWLTAPASTVFRQPDTLEIQFSSRILQTTSQVKSAIQLTKDGNPLSTSGLVVQAVNDTTYRVRGLRALSSNPGVYQANLALTNLSKYLTGSNGNGNLSRIWTVQRQNSAPVANAGTNRTISQAGIVNLNGGSSTDPESDPLTYTWVAPAGILLSDSTLANPTFSISQANNGNTYNFLLIVSDGDLFSTDVVQITVDIQSNDCGTPGNPLPPKPVISANGPLSFCQGGTVVLTTSATGSHKWSTGETTASITVSIGSTITDTAYSGTCKSVSDPVVVTVNPNPTKPVISGGPLTFCQGGSVVLSTNATGSHKWSTGATTATISVSTSGSVRDTAILGTCKVVSDPVVVTVNPNPTKPVISGGPLTFCQGGSVVLSTNATGTHKWSTGATTPTISVSTSGSVRDTAILGTCKVVSDPVVVTVNPNPTKPVISGGPLTFCQGGSVVLSTNATGTHRWSTGAATTTISVSISGSVRDTAILGTCKVVSDPVVVTVNPNPTKPVISGGPLTFCQGGSVVLSTNAAGTHKWSTGATTPTISVSTSGSVRDTAILGTCKVVSDPVVVTVNSLPTVDAGLDIAVVQNSGNTTLTGIPSGGTWSGTGVSTVGVFSSSGSIGQYKLTYCVTNAQNCTKCDSLTANITNGIPVQVATPVISPGTGSYNSSQLVSISCSTPGAQIYYTTTGNTPVVGTTFTKLYSAPIQIISTTNVKAMGVFAGSANSAVASSVLTILNPGIVSAPVITPGTSTVSGPVSVSITCATTDASIYYTTNGNTPVVGTTFTKLYTGPFNIIETSTVKAMAVRTGLANSSVVVSNITMLESGIVKNPVISPGSGTFDGSVVVSISTSTPDAQIYYSTSGNTPVIGTGFTRLYTGPFTLKRTTTVRAMAMKTGLVNSGVTVANLVVNAPSVVAAPTFSPAPGTYPSRILVSISSATDGAQIYFTNNGITPSNTTLAARLYSTPINVGSSGPIKAIAYKAGLETSPVSVGSYVIGAARLNTDGEDEEPFYYLQTEPDSQLDGSEVDVIPNPSNGRFRITSNREMKDAHIHIYNMLGQLVLQSDKIHDQLSFDVDISQQPTGFYTVVLMEGNARKVLRVTKE